VLRSISLEGDTHLAFSKAYIQRLASFEVRTSAFARASASLSAGPWANAHPGQTLSPTDGVAPSASSTSMRPVLSESEINAITRNLGEILRIHEDLLASLRRIMTSSGVLDTLGKSDFLRPESDGFLSLTSALEAISKKFIAEVSSTCLRSTPADVIAGSQIRDVSNTLCWPS